MDNKSVVENWKHDKKGKAGSIHTDGSNLYSYALLIGYTEGGNKIVINYMGKNSYSQTTSHHVSLAKRYADKVVEPSGNETDTIYHKEELGKLGKAL